MSKQLDRLLAQQNELIKLCEQLEVKKGLLKAEALKLANRDKSSYHHSLAQRLHNFDLPVYADQLALKEYSNKNLVFRFNQHGSNVNTQDGAIAFLYVMQNPNLSMYGRDLPEDITQRWQTYTEAQLLNIAQLLDLAIAKRIARETNADKEERSIAQGIVNTLAEVKAVHNKVGLVSFLTGESF